MGIVRNSIDVVGITNAKDLPTEVINGHFVQYSETETFFIPRGKSLIRDIFQVVINIETNSKREVKTPIGRTTIIDGTKNIKVIYSEKGHSSKRNIVNINVPFNTFTELEEDKEIDEVKVYILDAYFSLVENRKLYSHLVYMVQFIYKDFLKESDDEFLENTKFINDEDFESEEESQEESEEEFLDEDKDNDEINSDEQIYFEYEEENGVLEDIVSSKNDTECEVDEIEFDINSIQEYEVETNEVIECIPAGFFEESNLGQSDKKTKKKNKKKNKRIGENELAQDSEEYEDYSKFDCEYL